ncbi:Sulfotransferase (sult) [Halocaridina rubra]|uniref:Sulfotransferase (Sult) n=1 Tax=Halocaridina rubra TaxID=373956 RepID=A0AAN8XG37_HALRR
MCFKSVVILEAKLLGCRHLSGQRKMALSFPHKFQPLDATIMKTILEKFPIYTEGLLKVGPKGYVFKHQYTNLAEKYYNFKLRSDDVFIMTFPKCGTTWMQEIAWTMRNQVNVNTDLELNVRAPFLEFDCLESMELEPLESWLEDFNSRNPGKDYKTEGLYLELATSCPSPRTIKTHLPFSLLNPSLLDTTKVIYVARNPRDTCVSFYHHHRLVKVNKYIGNFDEFVDFWCQDLLTYSPYLSHLAEGWSMRDHPKVLFLFYEDMQEDIMRELRKLNDFLGTSLREEELKVVAEHVKFANMKSRSTCNPTAAGIHVGRFEKNEGEFVRKGITGDWVNYFTPHIEEKFSAWLKSSKEAKNIPMKYRN